MRITEPGRGTQRYSHTRIPTGAYLPATSLHDPLRWSRGWGAAHDSSPHDVDVLVIGAGQAGLASAYELRRRGFAGYVEGRRPSSSEKGTFLVVDAEYRPGGAWQHRWPTLTMATVNHIADLPGLPVGQYDPHSEAADFVPSYFAEFEDLYDLPILRPILVHSVAEDTSPGKEGLLRVETTAGTFRARVIINCTGTWTRPFLPYFPGAASFRGKQYHSQDYPGPWSFEGQHVMVVGGGISALSHLTDLAPFARTTWVTRTPPRWRDGSAFPAAPHAVRSAENLISRGIASDSALGPEEGRAIEARVRARIAAGLAPLPVVAETGLPVNAWTEHLRDLGVLERLPLFDRLTPDGAQWADGTVIAVDSIIWATGFRAELRHLAPLHLRASGGGVPIDGSHVAGDPRIYLVGYGPSASTIGARSAARRSVKEIADFLA